MTVTLYEATVTPILRNLSGCQAILAKAITWATETSTDHKSLLQETRLAPDMLPLAFQFHVVADAATRFVNRLRDQEPVQVDFTKYETLTQVLEAIVKAEEKLKTVTAEEVEAARSKKVVMNLGPVLKYEVTMEQLATGYSLPNVFFHTTTAYGLLRSKGVQLGKAEFITPFLGPVLATAKTL